MELRELMSNTAFHLSGHSLKPKPRFSDQIGKVLAVRMATDWPEAVDRRILILSDHL